MSMYIGGWGGLIQPGNRFVSFVARLIHYFSKTDITFPVLACGEEKCNGTPSDVETMSGGVAGCPGCPGPFCL